MREPVQVFKYPGKDGDGGRDAAEGRKSFPMCQTDNVISTVQVFQPGVHNGLHFHGFEDGYWFVLGGQATFYGEGDSEHARSRATHVPDLRCQTRDRRCHPRRRSRSLAHPREADRG